MAKTCRKEKSSLKKMGAKLTIPQSQTSFFKIEIKKLTGSGNFSGPVGSFIVGLNKSGSGLRRISKIKRKSKNAWLLELFAGQLKFRKLYLNVCKQS